MKDIIHKIADRSAAYLLTYALTVVICIGALLLSALIPRSALRENMRSSAELLCENRVFFSLSDGIAASKIDRYADSILLNIAYYFDAEDPLYSVMMSEYYFKSYQNENDNLREALTEDPPPTTQYMRYWHGSAVPVRIAHLFTDIKGMYIINACVMAALIALLMFVLIRRKLYAGAVGSLAALIAAGIWYVPFSLEYTWVFLITPAAALITVKLVLKGYTRLLGLFFMVTGILTNYFDFLTAETLTLTFPLILAIYTIRKTQRGTPKTEALRAFGWSAAWGAGYAGMWVLKWIFTAITVNADVTPYITEHISERSFGSTTGNENIPEALARNFGALFPVGYGGIGIAAFIVLILAAAYVCFVYRRDGIKPSDLLIYAAIGVIPYIRYSVMMNHSWLHFFFAYRAQAATVLALCMIVAEISFTGRSGHEAHKRKHA